jgi:predicted secreted acid phosphatase
MEGTPGNPPLKVLIWVGDNIQDFPNLTQASPGNPGDFGVRYFVLPNPMYGSWQKLPAR